jgi:serine/threonine-protein kinase
MNVSSEESKISEESIREELTKILASPIFRNAARVRRFLTHVVDQTLQGRSDQLKEYVIGLAVFDRAETFDPRMEPVVRVEAGRLRQKLLRYYQTDGREDPVRIEILKGSYVPVFRRNASEDEAAESSSVQPIAVAIGQFTDNSGNKDQGYICEGITEELTRILTRIEGLQVFSPSGRGWAQVILEGAVRREGTQLRISARLTERRTGRYLWSDRFVGEIAQLMAMQDEIAAAVVRTLNPPRAAFPFPAARATKSGTSYRLYLKGRHFAGLRTSEGLHESIRLYEKSLAGDPDFALAHTGLADSYTLLANYGVLPPADVRDRAYTSAERAVQLAPHVAEVHASLGHVLATYIHDWEKAEEEYESAIELNPGLAVAHHWYAITCLMPQKRLSEAKLEIETAVSLDPVSISIARDVSVIAWARREFESAIDLARGALQKESGFHESYWILALACEQLCRFDEALESLEYGAHVRRSPRMIGALGHVLALMGRTTEAADRLVELNELSEERYVSPFDKAVVCLGLGGLEASLDFLEAANAANCYESVWLKVDPRFDPLRTSPRFQSILQELGL